MVLLKRILLFTGFVGVLSGFAEVPLPNNSTPARALAPTFVNMQIHGDGGVYNVARQRFLVITPGYFMKSAQIFTTRSGVTLYAFVDEAGLKVYNADNGDHLLDLPFYKMPLLSDFNRAHAELEFEARVSEGAGGVEIAVLPAQHARAWRGVTELPSLKLNLQTRKISTAS